MGLRNWWQNILAKEKDDWKGNWKRVFANNYLTYVFQIRGGENTPIPTADNITNEQLVHLDTVIPETFEAFLCGTAMLFRPYPMRSYNPKDRTEIIVEMLNDVRQAEHKGAMLMAMTTLGVSASNGGATRVTGVINAVP